MWLLPSVDQEVLLQVSQLGEAFVTGLTFERSLSTVDTKMNLHGREEETKRLLRLVGKTDLHSLLCGVNLLCGLTIKHEMKTQNNSATS